MLKYKFFFLLLIGFGLIVSACNDDIQNNDLEQHTYNPTTYTVPRLDGFPAMEIPADNPMTEEGIHLGQLLFHDPILSRDFTISCSSCHNVKQAFTDGLPKAVGIDGRVGRRNAMMLINIGYSWQQNRNHNFMWDGRFPTLEEQAIAPVEDHLEMDADWNTIVQRFKDHDHYPRLFREAFGIKSSDEISKELAAKAIAQYERTLNSADSKYDKYVRNEIFLTPEEENGLNIFIGDAFGNHNNADGECAHCHSFSGNKQNFARNNFSNNGLDQAMTFNDFSDKGFGEFTSFAKDNGKFREVSIRNIELTAPYMHDGRFQTLEEVINHYASGGKSSPNLAPEISTAPTLTQLSVQDKADLVSFMKTLTDTSYYSKPCFQNPFTLSSDPWSTKLICQ